MKRLLILALSVLGLSLLTAMVTVAADTLAEPGKADLMGAKSPPHSAQLIAFELWIIRMRDAADPKNADELEQLSTRPADLPTILGDRDQVRAFIDRMQARKRLRSTAEYRLTVLDGQKSLLLDSAQLPQVTGVTLSDFGQSNNLLYRQVGTNIELTPRVERDRTITVDIRVEQSRLEVSDEVAITKPKEGDAEYAVTIPALTLKTNVSLENGDAVLVAQMNDSEKHTTELLILSAAFVKPMPAAKDGQSLAPGG